MQYRAKISLMLTVLWLFPISAYAYLDPGAGSVLIQGVLGAIAAIGVAIKLYWHRILKFLGIRKSKKELDAEGSQQEHKAEKHHE